LDAGTNGIEGVIGSDNSSHIQRIARYGKASWDVAENISHGTQSNGEEIVMSLLIDDGVADRVSR
jgi:uncharacterized protein YkwD